jgi:type IV secretory system conjugative DNA transfer VirD4/TraG family protein
VAWRFWNEEYPNYSKDYQSDGSGAILNKIGQFISSPTIRAILGQRHPKFDLATALARGQIVIVNLARGTIGETSSRLLGGLFTTYLHQHATARPAEDPDIPAINVIVDEFQLLGANLIFRDLMSSSRKRNIRMTIAHQNLSQIDGKLREEILSNISTLIAFKLGPNDAEQLAEELDCPRHIKLTDLDPGIARIKSPIVTSPEWIECADRAPHKSRAAIVITESKRRFARPRELIERDFRISDAERAAAARRASKANGARNR